MPKLKLDQMLLFENAKKAKSYRQRKKVQKVAPTEDDVESVWLEFRPIVFSIQAKQDRPNWCPEWWRSRFYDSLVCPRGDRNPKGFDFERKCNRCWEKIWDNYKYTMTQEKSPAQVQGSI